MSTNNLGTINTNSRASEENFFNNIALPPISVSQNVDDAVIAYFQQITETKEAARALAAAVIVTSVSQGADPMQTLDEFMHMDKSQLSAYTTMFLNINRIGTSFLGIVNQPTTGKYIARTILA